LWCCSRFGRFSAGVLMIRPDFGFNYSVAIKHTPVGGEQV
jgi:hypothetical protein